MSVQLNQEARRIIEVLDLNGDAVTGLIATDFTFTLQYHDSSDDTLDAAPETVSLAEIGSGAYWVTFTPTASATLYRLTITPDTATYTVNPSVIQVDVESGFAASGGPYLTTRANVKTALNITSADDDARIDALLAHVTDWAESHCGRNFFSATYTDYYKGKGYDSTALNLDVFPVSSVTSVHVSEDLPRVYDATTLLTADSEYIIDEDPGILYRTDGGKWPEEPKAVQVVYVAGYATIPGDLERAAIEVIAVKLLKGKFKLYHITSENRGDGDIAGIRFDDIPDDAMRVLNRYRVRRVA